MKHFLLILPLCALAACVQPEPPATPPPEGADTCGAARYQGLVGQPRAVLDKMTLPPAARVIGPRDPVTMDLRVDRINFEIGENGKIARIGCF